MSDLSATIVAAWHDQEAEKHLDLAQSHREMAQRIRSEIIRFPRQAVEGITPEAPPKSITLAELEAELAKKGGRAAHVAARLNTSAEVVEALLKDPASMYKIGGRGFIYLKTDED